MIISHFFIFYNRFSFSKRLVKLISNRYFLYNKKWMPTFRHPFPLKIKSQKDLQMHDLLT